MSVAHDASSESHTGTTGSASEASFTWNHGGGSPQGALVFVLTVAGVYDTAKDTSVTYGGVAMQLLNALANDTTTEPGVVRTYFLGENVPTGTQAVIVNRTNDASVMYAVCATVTAGTDTWVPPTWVYLENNGTLDEQAVSDTGISGTDSQRYAFGWSGLGAPPSAGTSSTLLQSIDFDTNVAWFVQETTAGTGSRNVGASSVTSDDRAAIHLVIEELPSNTVRHEHTSESHLGAAESTSEASFSWTHPGGSPKGVIVCVVTRANATAVGTAVTYGGTSLTQASALNAQDTAGEPGRIQIWHLGSGISTGDQTVTVTRTNDANPAFAFCTTVRADLDTELDTADAVIVSGDGTLSEQSVSDTSGRGNSLRYCMGWGGSSPSSVTAGANSKITKDHGYSLSGAQVACEQVPGTGSRSVGLSTGVSDDRAYAHFAIQQIASVGFTADAVIQATPSSTFTADAVLRVVQTGSFTADAVLRQTKTGSITANSVLKATVSASATADAVLKKTLSSSFTADAVITLSGAQAFTADAVLRKTLASSATADSVLKRNLTSSATADSVIRATRSSSATADAVLNKNLSSSAAADAVVRKTLATSATADAVIGTAGYSFTADAVIKKSRSATFTADAVVGAPPFGRTFTVRAVVKKTIATTITADAMVVHVFTMDALITRHPAATFTADAIIGRHFGSFAADASIFVPGTGSFSVDARIVSAPQGVSVRPGRGQKYRENL